MCSLFIGYSALLSRPLLAGCHPIAAVAEFEAVFLAFEADALEISAAVVVMLHDRGGISRGRGEIDQVRRNFGYNVLAAHDAQLDVGSAAFPLQLVFAGLQFGSVDIGWIVQLEAGLRTGECAGRHQQCQTHEQTL